ncbi:MAG: SDR family oxidoreductase [Bacteroidetes bacterium]|nr:SDR family oxidoreductase [Bacteroidota bacterium]
MAKTIIITGASSGIGEALAYYAASLQYNIVLAARNLDKLITVKEQCMLKGANCIAVKCDVSIEEDCKKLISETISQFSTIDILINNAGISMRAIFNDCDLKVIEQVMAINFFGAVYCTKFALPYVLNNKGSVVGISSIAGIKGLPGRTGYSASKFAMHGFLESLRLENLKTGLHVLIACPGYTASNIRNTALNQSCSSQAESPFDESKLMQPQQVAEAIFKAIGKRKNYLYLTFQGKVTVFLSKFFPKLLDKLVYKTVAKEKDSPFK